MDVRASANRWNAAFGTANLKTISGEEPIKKPLHVRSPYKLIYGPDWHNPEDGQSLNLELLQRMNLLVQYLLEHDMVTSNIRFNEGVRSRKRAHRMSTSWFLRQPDGPRPSKIPLKNLQALHGGKDLDGNKWYDKDWEKMLELHGLPPDALNGRVNVEESKKEVARINESNLRFLWEKIQKNAEAIEPQSAIAAEGYAVGDPHILPNVHPVISNHVGGNAIDCTIPWKPGVLVRKYANGDLEPPKGFGEYDMQFTSLFITNGGTTGGLNDLAANFVVAHFGLCRPVNKVNPKTGKGAEPWHFQLAPDRRPLS